jgi:hypothetical protein
MILYSENLEIYEIIIVIRPLFDSIDIDSTRNNFQSLKIAEFDYLDIIFT